MENILQQAIEYSDYQSSLNIQKKFLREKFDADTTFGKDGGLFKIDQSLILFTKFLIDNNKITDVVILDSNKNPILITNILEFNREIVDRYFSALGSYHAGYEELKTARRMKHLAEL